MRASFNSLSSHFLTSPKLSCTQVPVTKKYKTKLTKAFLLWSHLGHLPWGVSMSQQSMTKTGLARRTSKWSKTVSSVGYRKEGGWTPELEKLSSLHKATIEGQQDQEGELSPLLRNLVSKGWWYGASTRWRSKPALTKDRLDTSHLTCLLLLETGTH